MDELMSPAAMRSISGWLSSERKKMIPGPHRSYRGFIACIAVVLQFFIGATAKAEDGYRLWLRYDPLPRQVIGAYRPHVTSVVVPGVSATLDAIRAELARGCAGLFASPVPLAAGVDRDGALVVGTPKSSPLIAGLNWGRQL